MQSVLILGNKGMLGGEFMRQFGLVALGWDREEADVTDVVGLRSKILNLHPLPEAIVNCVAYNDVDGAELKKDLAFLLNAKVPQDLSQISNELNIPLVHFSSNYVFDGKKESYEEADLPNPLSTYGRSKFAGEQAVVSTAKKYYLIRTSVLFGPKAQSAGSKRSFIELMQDASYKQDFVSAVEDEINSLTYVADLVKSVRILLETSAEYGIYHITNSGRASWYDFAKEIFKITRPGFLVKPVKADFFKRPAQRPQTAVLVSRKLPALRPWQEALREFLNN